jgi:predicted MFS family arabinose efflux permease
LEGIIEKSCFKKRQSVDMEKGRKMSVATTNQYEQKTPTYAWVILVVCFFVSISAPLNVFKVPGIAPVLMTDLNIDLASFGWLMSISNLLGTILPFFVAGMIVKTGSKMTCLIACASVCVGSVIGALSSSFFLLLFSRALEGVGMGIFLNAMPELIGRWFPARTRGKALGAHGIWVPCSIFIMLNLSPAITAVAGWRAVWWFGAIYAAIAFVLTLVFIKYPEENLYEEPAKAVAKTEPKSARTTIAVILVPSIWLIGVASFVMNFVMNGTYNTYFATYLQEVGGMDAAAAGFTTSVITALALIGTPMAGVISDFLRSRKWTIFIGLVITGIGAWIAFDYRTTIMLYVFLIIAGLFSSMVNIPGFAAAAELMKSPKDAAWGVAIITTLGGLGQVVGGVCLGYLQPILGWATASHVLLIPAIIIALIAVFFVKEKRLAKLNRSANAGTSQDDE